MISQEEVYYGRNRNLTLAEAFNIFNRLKSTEKNQQPLSRKLDWVSREIHDLAAIVEESGYFVHATNSYLPRVHLIGYVTDNVDNLGNLIDKLGGKGILPNYVHLSSGLEKGINPTLILHKDYSIPIARVIQIYHKHGITIDGNDSAELIHQESETFERISNENFNDYEENVRTGMTALYQRDNLFFLPEAMNHLRQGKNCFFILPKRHVQAGLFATLLKERGIGSSSYVPK